MNKNMKKEITLILVTYNPQIAYLKKIISELKNESIIISDNGSKNIFEIQKLSENKTNVFLIRNDDNLGIAEAQNKAILKAKEKYLFFLDQDSYISEESLLKLKNDLEELKKMGYNLGCLAATNQLEKKKINKHFERVEETISSGMLIPSKIIKKVGLMRSEFFIDMVDYEWCWRAKKKGFLIIRDNYCNFQHQIGHQEYRIGKIVISPVRLYYVFRNNIILINENKVPLKYHSKYRLFKQFIFNILFCPARLKRFLYIILGIRDGKRKKMGKFNYAKR